MLRLMECEFLKLKRRPLVFISLVLSVFMPLAYIFFLSDVNTDVDAVNGVMSSLFQLSAYLLLMPLLVILASSLLFQELDHDTLKNLAAVPVGDRIPPKAVGGRKPCFYQDFSQSIHEIHEK